MVERVEGAASPRATDARVDDTRAPARLAALRHSQGMAFMALGVVNTFIGFVAFVGFELTVGQRTGYLVVLLLAHFTSVACAFVLYRRFVFRVTGHVWRDLARFESVYLTALAMNVAMLPFLVEVMAFPVIAAQTAIVSLGAVMSFFGHKHFSFRRPRPQND